MNALTLTMTMSGLVFLAEPAQSAATPGVQPVDLTKVTQLIVEPATIRLDDPRSKQRLVVTGKVGEKLVDVTDVATIKSSNEGVVRLNDRFEALPMADGAAQITVQAGAQTANIAVAVSNFAKGRPVNFANEIVPIFTKLTCNSGGCHGKSGGQNGFSLSLLGFVPEDDYDFLVKEGRGRRLFPASPDQSLLLGKAIGRYPHGGGKLMKKDDDNYQLIHAWIKQGMPYGTPADPTVTQINVYPDHRIMDRQASQRLRVTATYSDGRVEDVTRHALFQSNNDEVAAVDVGGKVTTRTLSGESAIMARYMGQVAVFRATVPVGKPIQGASDFVAKNFIDTLTSKKWTDLGLTPSPRANDYQFIRRLSVDLCGKLPEPSMVMQFVSSADPNKREALIEQLLSSQEYASFMAMKWGAVLQNKRAGRADYAEGTHAMSLWLKKAFYTDMPYDEFARRILTANGTPEMNPPVSWYRSVRTSEDNVDNCSQLFLGTRIQCARCHHHPFEKWSQDDYYGMAAFFSRLGRKNFETSSSGQPAESIFVMRTGDARHPKTGQIVLPKGLDAPPVQVAAGEDPRQKLAEWMTKPENKLFAQAFVNRLWGHFFTRGIVDPIDDMRVTNPPSNPELLDALAKDFVDHKFSIKHAVRMICSSTTYQLSSEPNEYNINDKQNFARYYPKRLQAEVLLDALDQVTAVPTGFGFPAGMRAVDLPDEQVGSYFLDIFGRPQRSSSCECERTMEANLSQALHLLNSGEVQGKLTAGNGRAALLAADMRPDDQKVNELFLWFFARPPRADELKAALDHIASKPDKKVAYQNLIWALLNTKEFQFNT